LEEGIRTNLESGGSEGIPTPNSLFTKPRIDFRLASKGVLERLIKDNENPNDMTPKCEKMD
jgi:phosphoribosyl 1,2-cyclic phosphodiesterase